MSTPKRKAKPRLVSFTAEVTPEEHRLLESSGHNLSRGASSFARLLFVHALRSYTRMEPRVGVDGFFLILKGLGEETARKRAARIEKEMDQLISASEWTQRYARGLRTSYRNELAARVAPKQSAR